MRSNLAKLALGAARRLSILALGVALPVLAQEASAQGTPLPFKEESVGDYKGPGSISAKGTFVGTPLVVDQAFTTTHENAPPSAAFTVIVPRGEDLRFLAGGKKSGASELVKLTLPSKDGKQAAEILRFVSLYMPGGAAPARLSETATILRTKAAAMITAGYEAPTLLDLYATRIGGYDAVSMHLQMTKPGTGEVFLVKAAAILHPQADGVLTFLMADNKLSEVKTADDLRSKGIGLRIIHSLKFQDGTSR